MAWLTTDAKPIVEGWGKPGDFSAPNIGATLAAILEDRRKREALTGAGIAETIKNVRGERQSNELLDAMRAADLVPKDYEAQGVGGATYGLKLADQLREKLDSEARRQYLTDIGDAAGGGGGGGGGGGTDYGSTEFDTQYPPVRTNEFGIQEYRKVTRGPHGGVIVNYQPYSTPIQPTTTRQPGVKDTYQMEHDVEKDIDALQLHRKIQEMEDTKKGVTDPAFRNRPFQRQSEEDKLREKLLEIRRMRENPPPDDQSGQNQTRMPQQRFGSEQEARAAGHQAGDTVLILDPATKRYRPAVLD